MSYASNTNSDTGSSGMSSLFGLIVIGVMAWFIFTKVDFNSSNNYRYQERNSLDLVDDAAAGPGQINIMEQVFLYDDRDTIIGEFKHGVPEDSLKLYLKSISIEKAKQAWTLSFMLHNFRTVDSSVYAMIRKENFK